MATAEEEMRNAMAQELAAQYGAAVYPGGNASPEQQRRLYEQALINLSGQSSLGAGGVSFESGGATGGQGPNTAGAGVAAPGGSWTSSIQSPEDLGPPVGEPGGAPPSGAPGTSSTAPGGGPSTQGGGPPGTTPGDPQGSQEGVPGMTPTEGVPYTGLEHSEFSGFPGEQSNPYSGIPGITNPAEVEGTMNTGSVPAGGMTFGPSPGQTTVPQGVEFGPNPLGEVRGSLEDPEALNAYASLEAPDPQGELEGDPEGDLAGYDGFDGYDDDDDDDDDGDDDS